MKSYVFLFQNDLFPDNLKILEDLKNEQFKITALIDKRFEGSADIENYSPRKEAGLLSTLTQLLSLSSAEEENAQIEKAKHVSLARECVEKCHLERLSLMSRY
jgi:hypothetical protein